MAMFENSQNKDAHGSTFNEESLYQVNGDQVDDVTYTNNTGEMRYSPCAVPN